MIDGVENVSDAVQLAHGDDGGLVAGIELRDGEALGEGRWGGGYVRQRGWDGGGLGGGGGRGTDAAEGPRWAAIHATACEGWGGWGGMRRLFT